MFILQAWTPNVCTIEEGVITLLFAPLMVFLAFCADKGYFDRDPDSASKRLNETIPDNVSMDEMAQIEQTIREENKGVDLTADQVLNIMSSKYFTNRSRAYYGKLSRKGDKKRNSMVAPLPEFNVVSAPPTSDCAAEDRPRKDVRFGFEFAQYAFLENCGEAKLNIVRTGYEDCKATVKFKTRDGTAKASSPDQDYEMTEGEIVFPPGDKVQEIKIKIMNDNAYEDNEEFFVDLFDPGVVEEAGVTAKLGDNPIAIVVIIDDDHAGTIKFEKEEIEVEEGTETTTVKIQVMREDGASGTVSCTYATEDMNAVASMDYESTCGTLEMIENVQSYTIEVPIMTKGRFTNDADFIVRLSEPKGGAVFDKDTDGGEQFCICHVVIKGKMNETRVNMLQRMGSRIRSQTNLLGTRNWRQQFHDALFQVVDDDDDDDEDDAKDGNAGPSVFDYFMHAITLPWKLLFAFVPPTDYCDGWMTFAVSLAMIGLVTALVGDMANLLGDCIGLNPEITAITFVALGTSLPDTFASKTAAAMDEHADASIGNITGSNSVNVFLGLGISWTMAAIYWQMQEIGDVSSDYVQKVLNPDETIGIYYSVRDSVSDLIDLSDSSAKAVFIAPAGSLWFNLMVFSLNAFAAIQHLWARRRKWGGELGGPKHGVMGQYFSAGWLCCQWIIYIGASSIYATIHEND
jgi:solute carrier family 8 (sodium/calcium exchanger)